MRGVASLWMVAAVMVLLVGIATLLRRRPQEVHKRGTVILEGARRRRRSRWSRAGGAAHAITLAGVDVPFRDETKHFKMIGTTGTGKSTAIQELLAGALGRGDRAVVADPDGGYQARFFQRYRGDVVLNPFDAASVRWDPFSEINDAFDVEQLSAALI